MKLIKISSVAVLSTVALFACERREVHTETVRRDEPVVTKSTEPLPAPKTTEEQGPMGGGPGTMHSEREHARDRLAAARCDHYKTCGDIAKDKKYDTLDSCLTREKADIDKDWKVDDCSNIDNDRLSACLAAVTGKKCDMLFHTSPSECAESKVCIKK